MLLVTVLMLSDIIDGCPLHSHHYLRRRWVGVGHKFFRQLFLNKPAVLIGRVAFHFNADNLHLNWIFRFLHSHCAAKGELLHLHSLAKGVGISEGSLDGLLGQQGESSEKPFLVDFEGEVFLGSIDDCIHLCVVKFLFDLSLADFFVNFEDVVGLI